MNKTRAPVHRLATVLLAFACPSQASAHCEVGDRTFASTITFDDPCVMDELSLPTIQSLRNGDEPSAQELDASGEYTKTITRNFGISFEEQWVHLDVPRGAVTVGLTIWGPALSTSSSATQPESWPCLRRSTLTGVAAGPAR
jgi:hypothetical protein